MTKDKRKHVSLRGRLILLVALSMTPVVALVLLAALGRREADVTLAYERVERVAEEMAHRSADLLEDARRTLNLISHLPMLQDEDPEASGCSELLRGMVADDPRYSMLGVVSVDDRPLCSSLPTADTVSALVYFPRTVRSRAFSVEYDQSRGASGIPILPVGHPVFDAESEEDLLGVVYAGLRLDLLGDGVGLPSGSSVLVLDRSGTVLTHASEAAVVPGTILPPEHDLVGAVLAARDGTGRIETRGVDGVERLYAYHPLLIDSEGISVQMFVGIAGGEVRGAAHAELSRSLTTLALVTLAALIAAWMVGGRAVLRDVAAISHERAELIEVARQAQVALTESEGHLRGLIEYAGNLTGEPLAESVDEEDSVRMAEVLTSALDIPGLRSMLINARNVALSAVSKEEEARIRQAQRFESLGQITGGLAHDFNNMLQAIIGNLELLGRSGTLDGKEGQRVARALAAANRCAQMTKRLLVYAGTQPMVAEAVHLGELLEETRDFFTGALGSRVPLDISVDPDVPIVSVHAGELQQALVNLALNARDALPERDGRVTIHVRNTRVDADAPDRPDWMAPGAYVVVSFRDNGSGMSPEVRERAFDPFFTTKPADRGTGLGLSQVYGFVKHARGYVLIDSVPGAGTTVRLYLPSLMAPTLAEAAGGV